MVGWGCRWAVSLGGCWNWKRGRIGWCLNGRTGERIPHQGLPECLFRLSPGSLLDALRSYQIY